MCAVTQIGSPPWTHEEIEASLAEFAEVYAGRPIKHNAGGMGAPHMFATWFMVRKLNPDLIVESGIWRGQSTWLLEQACPDAKLISIDLRLDKRSYIAQNATYYDRDFSELDWTSITDRSLAFFDDHQDAYKRIQQCKWFGFKHIILEDNYANDLGGVYSLKQAFANTGFEPQQLQLIKGLYSLMSVVSRIGMKFGIASIPQTEQISILPNDIDSHYLRKHLQTYYEFPPIIKTANTRWGGRWDDESYPTPQPLLTQVEQPAQQIFLDEAASYTWICYAKLK